MPESFAVSLYALKLLVHSICQLKFDYLLEPVLVLAGTFLATIFIGRYYCGYICAFGAMQDLAFDVRRLIWKGGRACRIPSKADTVLSKIKYAVLVCILVLAALNISIPGDFSPWTSFGYITALFKGRFDPQRVLSVGLFVLIAIIIFSGFVYRAFCRFLCPLGAAYSLLSLFSYDRRKRTCKSSGHCSICPHKCERHKVHYWGLAITLVLFIGVNVYLALAMNTSVQTPVAVEKAKDAGAPAAETETGPYQNGIYEGSGTGYRGNVHVVVTMENGCITAIELTEHDDDAAYMNIVQAQLIPEMLKAQSAQVDVVSGATYSSVGLIEAVENAVGAGPETKKAAEQASVDVAEEEPADENAALNSADLSHLDDGVYEGAAIGYRGEIRVAVTVKDHEIEKIRILSYYDNEEYLFHAAPAVIDAVMNEQPLDVDVVTGATYSSNGLMWAIANAIEVDESTFEILEARPRAEKHKKAHHVTQKFIESDEQYEELVEKYRDLIFGPDGKRLK